MQIFQSKFLAAKPWLNLTYSDLIASLHWNPSFRWSNLSWRIAICLYASFILGRFINQVFDLISFLIWRKLNIYIYLKKTFKKISGFKRNIIIVAVKAILVIHEFRFWHKIPENRKARIHFNKMSFYATSYLKLTISVSMKNICSKNSSSSW